MFTTEEEKEAEKLVERGDIHGLLQLFDARMHPGGTDFSGRIDYLMRAYRVATRQNRDGALGEVYRMMMDFTVELLLISQTQATDHMSRMVSKGVITLETAQNEVTRILPTLERLHQHLMELTKSYATAEHTRQLTQNALSKSSDALQPAAEIVARSRQRGRRK